MLFNVMPLSGNSLKKHHRSKNAGSCYCSQSHLAAVFAVIKRHLKRRNWTFSSCLPGEFLYFVLWSVNRSSYLLRFYLSRKGYYIFGFFHFSQAFFGLLSALFIDKQFLTVIITDPVPTLRNTVGEIFSPIHLDAPLRASIFSSGNN